MRARGAGAALRGPAESSPMRRGLKGSMPDNPVTAARTRRIFPDEEGTESAHDRDTAEWLAVPAESSPMRRGLKVLGEVLHA